MPLIDLALVNDVWTLKLSMIQTVGLAVITLFIGTWINKHSKFLQPASSMPILCASSGVVSPTAAGSRRLVRNPILQGWYPNSASPETGVPGS